LAFAFDTKRRAGELGRKSLGGVFIRGRTRGTEIRKELNLDSKGVRHYYMQGVAIREKL